jgi:gamma-glutamyltranspeptidase/glutathione hydrolase
MKIKQLLLGVIVAGASFLATGQSFNNFPVTTQKPPLHGKHWMAITGKPLAATAGAMIFTKGGNAIDASCAMLAATCHHVGCTQLGGRNPGAYLQS